MVTQCAFTQHFNDPSALHVCTLCNSVLYLCPSGHVRRRNGWSLLGSVNQGLVRLRPPHQSLSRQSEGQRECRNYISLLKGGSYPTLILSVVIKLRTLSPLYSHALCDKCVHMIIIYSIIWYLIL